MYQSLQVSNHYLSLDWYYKTDFTKVSSRNFHRIDTWYIQHYKMLILIYITEPFIVNGITLQCICTWKLCAYSTAVAISLFLEYFFWTVFSHISSTKQSPHYFMVSFYLFLTKNYITWWKQSFTQCQITFSKIKSTLLKYLHLLNLTHRQTDDTDNQIQRTCISIYQGKKGSLEYAQYFLEGNLWRAKYSFECSGMYVVFS